MENFKNKPTHTTKKKGYFSTEPSPCACCCWMHRASPVCTERYTGDEADATKPQVV